MNKPLTPEQRSALVKIVDDKVIGDVAIIYALAMAIDDTSLYTAVNKRYAHETIPNLRERFRVIK